MEWISELLGVGLGAASGGIFGFISAGVGAVAKHYQAKAQHKRDMAIREWDMIAFDKQQTARRAETEDEVTLIDQSGSWSGIDASIAADAALSVRSPQWVSGVKSLFRPMLTAGLLVMVYFIWRDLLAGLGDNSSTLATILTEAEVNDLLKYIIYSMVFASTTAVVWWFGDRAFAPPHLKNK